MSSCLLERSSDITTVYQQEGDTVQDPFEEIKTLLLLPSSAITIHSPISITTTFSVESQPSLLLTPPITPTTKHVLSIASSPLSTPPSPILSSSTSLSSPSFIPVLTPPLPSPPPLPTTTTITGVNTSTSASDLSLSTLIPIAAKNLNNVEDSPSKEPAYYTLFTGIQKAIQDRKLGKSRSRNLSREWYRLANLMPITKMRRVRVIAMAGWFEHRDKTNIVSPAQLEKIVENLRKEIFNLKEEEFMNLLIEKRKSGTKDQV